MVVAPVAGAAPFKHIAVIPGNPVEGAYTSPVPPGSPSYIEVQGPDRVTHYTQSTSTTVGSPTSSTSLTLTMLQGWTITLTVGAGQSIQPGVVYSQQDGVSVSVGNGGQLCYNANGEGSVEVDQLAQDGSGQVTSAAMQFYCFDDHSSTVYGGAVSFNIVPTSPTEGYYIYADNGFVTGFGNDNYLDYLGDLSWETLNDPIVGMAITPDGGGYWLVASDGGVFSYGYANCYGSMGGKHLNDPIVGMATDTGTGGYWLVASDGGVFAFNAPYYGSMGGKHLNQPIVGVAARPGGNGYWFVASDGGIFAYDALFHGSMGDRPLAAPIIGMASTIDGGGYWEIATDGGIFALGDAQYFGSLGGQGYTGIAGVATNTASVG